MVKEVVIVGGGFGGVRAARRLSAWGRDIHITLIDKERYHTFHPELYEVATANLPEAGFSAPGEFYELRSTASYPLEDIFAHDLNVTVLHDAVTAIDFKKQEVGLASNKSHSYDILVLGMGSETNYFNIPHLYEYALPLKTLWDALQIRNELDELFRSKPKHERIHLVIGGGGFTGCEFAGELCMYARDLATSHGRAPELTDITIVEGSPMLLPGVDSWTQQKAKKRLERLCVKFIFERPIAGVEAKKIILKDGATVSFDCLIWTAGVRANELTTTFADIKPEKNLCMAVDEYLRIMPYTNVFSVGDVTYCVDPATGKSLPMTATVALREGRFVAENIKRMLTKKELRKYKPSYPGFVIPLGGKYAIFEIHQFHIAGIFPWILKNIISLKYWVGILGLRRGVTMWWHGAKLFLKND